MKRTVIILLFLCVFQFSFRTVAGNCYLQDVNWNIGVFILSPVEDVFAGPNFKDWSGINNIINAIKDETRPGFQYYDIVIQPDYFALTVNPAFANLENETATSSSAGFAMLINFECGDGSTWNMLFQQSVIDTNNHDPEFTQSSYEYKLPMPFPPGITLNEDWSTIPIEAKDIDFSNTDIIFTVDPPGDFEVIQLGTTDPLKKVHKMVLKSTHNLNLETPITYTITATDVGLPPRSSTSQLVINIDEQNSYPNSPTFEASYYTAKYEVNPDGGQDIISWLGATPIINDNADVEATLSLDNNDYFSVDRTGTNVNFNLVNNIPQDEIKANSFLVFVIKATSQELPELTANTVIIVQLPVEKCDVQTTTVCPEITSQVTCEPCDCTSTTGTVPGTTECPTAPTECPTCPTECPTGPTENPTGPTECPICPTECPTATTECPTTPTECPSCPTDCPTGPTENPTGPTECPICPTECPTGPTENPTGPTECPTCPTECPICPTECPTCPTECPTGPTECPTGPTECPTCPTECPTNPTECPACPTSPATTECPPCELTTPGPTQAPGTNLQYAQPEYHYDIPAIITESRSYLVTAIATPPEDIRYEILSNEVPNGITYNEVSGELLLQETLNVGIYEIIVKAAGLSTGNEATAVVRLTVISSTICDDQEYPAYSVVFINDVIENEERDINVLNLPQNSEYEYQLVSQFPLTNPFLFSIDPSTKQLHCKPLDRETNSQFHVITKLVKIGTPSVTTDVLLRDYFVPKAEDQCMIMEDITNEPAQTVFVINVQDDNDNSPVFVETAYEFGYPTKDLVHRVLAPAVGSLQATDADTGVNAQIKYSIEENTAFIIHPDTGVIYARDAFTQTKTFTAYATDRNGATDGNVTPVQVKVHALGNQHISAISLPDVNLEDLDEELKVLSQKIGIKVGKLTATLIPLGSDSKSSRINKEFELVVIAYGLDENENPVTYSVLKDKIEVDSDWEVDTLEDYINENYPCKLEDCDPDQCPECSFGGYIAAVVVLCILLVLFFAAAFAFYHFSLRKRLNAVHAEKQTVVEETTQQSPQEVKKSFVKRASEFEYEPAPRRRDTGFVFNSPPPDDEEYEEIPPVVKYSNINEYDEVAPDTSFQNNREGKKSVTFNEHIENREVSDVEDDTKSAKDKAE